MPEIMRESRIPADKVLQMRSQGVSNNQIIQILQREGYDLTAIFNAMNQADIKGGVDAAGMTNPDIYPDAEPTEGGQTMPQQSLPPLQYPNQQQFSQNSPDTGAMPQQDYTQEPAEQQYTQQTPQYPQQMPMQPQQMPMQQQYAPEQQYGASPSFETQRIEELAEAIIDEKWNEIVRSINKIIDWKERLETRVSKIEQQLEDLNKSMDVLHKGVLGKITDYDQNLTNVGAEIKAMEKVFQKVLPSLTESVGELGRITEGMKKK